MRPIVAVIGTTGVGKSQLAVHLAQSLDVLSSRDERPQHFEIPPKSGSTNRYDRGLVLSADSMQLYKGLDVITNKVTREEMGGVEHWGLDIVQPGKGASWELGRWCSEAGKVVKDLPETTLPIICGGTHYFIQNFLFPPPELSTSRPTSPGPEPSPKASSSRWTPPHPRPETPDLEPSLARLLDTFWTSSPVWPNSATNPTTTSASVATGAGSWSDAQHLSLHQLLAAVDPQEAGRWHWRDGRKVKRGLERWWVSGASDGKSEEIEGIGRKAKFRILIFWVYEPMTTLRPRLDKRVDKMVENGLLREIAELRDIAREIFGSAEAADHTEGIFQAIGYKEFSNLALDGVSDPTSDPAFPSMLERMKLSTHQYAKSQLKWIKNQSLPAIREARAAGGEVSVYVVPGGSLNEGLTQDILCNFLASQKLPDPSAVGHAETETLLDPLKVEQEGASGSNIAERQVKNARRKCDLCSIPSAPFSVMAKDWDIHVKSKAHRRNVIAADGGRDALIERQKKAGLEKKAERERLREAVPTPPPQEA